MKEITLPHLVIREIEKISEIAGYLWQQGWAERNAGNISINLTDMIDGIAEPFDELKFVEQQLPQATAGMIVFFTGTGKHLRSLIKSPENASCIIRINNQADGYHIIWGGKGDTNFRPTSEIIPHLKIHVAKKQDKSPHKTVLHTHPTELICLSHHPIYGTDEKLLNKALWSMLPEVKMFVPKGICLAHYARPGSEELANMTVEGLRKRDVAIWAKHGVTAAGSDIIEAFDYIDVANKGAKVLLGCLQAGFTPIING